MAINTGVEKSHHHIFCSLRTQKRKKYKKVPKFVIKKEDILLDYEMLELLKRGDKEIQICLIVNLLITVLPYNMLSHMDVDFFYISLI